MGQRADVSRDPGSSYRGFTDMFRRYLKCIDRFYNNYVSCFITGGSMCKVPMVYCMP